MGFLVAGHADEADPGLRQQLEGPLEHAQARAQRLQDELAGVAARF